MKSVINKTIFDVTVATLDSEEARKRSAEVIGQLSSIRDTLSYTSLSAMLVLDPSIALTLTLVVRCAIMKVAPTAIPVEGLASVVTDVSTQGAAQRAVWVEQFVAKFETDSFDARYLPLSLLEPIGEAFREIVLA